MLDCLDLSNILECISQNVKSNSQYYFDKYSNPVVNFFPVPYKNLYFKLNNISNFLDVYLHSFYDSGDDLIPIEKCCSFRILQTSFFTDFFKGIVACIKENQCNISSKNSVPVVVGGAGQYYSKAEIDSKLNEIKMLIRNISVPKLHYTQMRNIHLFVV